MAPKVVNCTEQARLEKHVQVPRHQYLVKYLDNTLHKNLHNTLDKTVQASPSGSPPRGWHRLQRALLLVQVVEVRGACGGAGAPAIGRAGSGAMLTVDSRVSAYVMVIAVKRDMRATVPNGAVDLGSLQTTHRSPVTAPGALAA
ncbi:hypothetical protein EKO04_000974 [Ascochyta lentis]|uniref:Uncharacterized protein n=1 Tax=Ascochyta lentis TaxID=205686 RepID=A0A8H7JDE4_9PLEO|nr:hypothetical protein EKO04_000974 [Ascochyta lentis]